MIKKILALKNIRSFRDFSAHDKEFQRKNIIYAPNGTGKTNLSRLFDKLSKNEPLDDLLSQESSSVNDLDFKIQLEDGIEVTKSNFDSHKNAFKNIYVFNTDYIEETIKSKNFSEIDVSGEVKIPIGKQSNEITDLKKSIKKSEKVRIDTKAILEESIKTFQDVKLKSESYTRQDINIWKELRIKNILNYNFTITPPIKNVDFDDCETKFKEISEIDENTSIDSSKLKTVDYSAINFEEITRELETPKHFKVFDQEIKSSIEEVTKNWIKETNLLQKGVKLSQEKGSCMLCNRDLDSSVEDLFNKYQAYFANEESKFKEKLTRYSKHIQNLKKQISNTNNNLEIEVNKYAKLFDTKKNWKKLQIEEIDNKLEDLEDAIQSKRDELGESFSVLNDSGIKYDFNNAITVLNDDIKENLELISSLNGKFSKTKDEKTKLRTSIGQKFLYEFYQDNKIDFDKIDTANASIEIDSKNLAIEQEKLPKTKVSSNIETLCNIFLRDYLYIDKYKVEEKDGVLALKLNDYDISNTTQKISEGEKTMISLVFFLASSIKKFDSPENFFNAVFIIDDPINSTSYNYFFGICNLLKFFDETTVSKLWSDEINKLSGSFLQKIILSHNTQFFNVIRENVFKGDNDKFFILTNNSLTNISRKRLSSEFENALYNIKQVIDNKNYQINIGNDLRRFFETIRHFYGIKAFNADALELIFRGFEEKKHHIFFTVINYYSHSKPEAHTDPLLVNFEPFLNEFEELIKKSQFKELWNNIKVD